MKYTKKEVQGMFNRLCKALEKENLILDYVSCYGGYVIEEKHEDTSISHPFGCFRRNAKEMYLSMWMATQLLEDIRHKQDQLNKYERV